MFCPQCGAEYREGFTTCSECEVALAAEPPVKEAEAEWRELVTVWSAVDHARTLVATSLLEEEGIPHFVRGEQLQDLFGMGRLGAGYNLLVGPAEVQVPVEHEARARELLAALPVESAAEPEGESDPSTA